MYKCKKCRGQSPPGMPQSKISYYREDGTIEKEDKVCYVCSKKYLASKEKKPKRVVKK